MSLIFIYSLSGFIIIIITFSFQFFRLLVIASYLERSWMFYRSRGRNVLMLNRSASLTVFGALLSRLRLTPANAEKETEPNVREIEDLHAQAQQAI